MKRSSEKEDKGKETGGMRRKRCEKRMSANVERTGKQETQGPWAYEQGHAGYSRISLALDRKQGVLTVERDHDINAFFKNMFYHSKGLKINK